MRIYRTILLALLALPWLASMATAQQPTPPHPREVLGHEVGADRRLAGWSTIVAYLANLASASPAVKFDTLGQSTLGRPFVTVTISSPENIRNLDAIRAGQRRLADPRLLTPDEERRLIASQPSVLVISCSIHSNEIAASQMSMELAWRLATNDTLQRALRNTIVVIIPSVNPDGIDMVTDFYQAHLGTEWEGGTLPWLYHHYVGHDNNRDWFMVTQRETKLVTDLLYRQWFPQVLYDVHQMGNSGMRFFVPPFVDPINPNVDPMIVRTIDMIGMDMQFALEQQGRSGVGSGIVFDLWWHGGMRSTPTRHNMVGILSEAASVRIATPIEQDTAELRGHPRGLPRYERRINFPNPWPGGRWSLRDIVEYELIASEALVQLMSRRRPDFVANFIALGQRQVRRGQSEPPYAFEIPWQQRDPGAMRELLRVLRDGGLEIHQRPGAYVVRLDQPYRAHAKDLLEVQRFPEGMRPYDVAGWTLPLQMGVRVISVDTPYTAALTRAPEIIPARHTACPAGGARGTLIADVRDTRAYAEVARRLRNGRPVGVLRTGARGAGGRSWPAGSFVLDGPADSDYSRALGASCERLERPAVARTIRALPRVALYKPWTANMDEGWTRWLLDEFGFPYVSLTDSMARAGSLRDHFDLLIVPNMSLREMREGRSESAVPPPYSGGLGTVGLESVATFVREGGTLLLLDAASEFATEQLQLPVTLIRSVRDDAGEDADSRLFAPGSILRVLVDGRHPLAAGMADTVGVYFTNSVSFEVRQGAPVRAIARYPERGEDILMSGYLRGAEAIAGRAAAVDAPIGRGRVVMFGFRPQHRGQSWGTFRMLFNSLLDSGPADRR
jgi:hypothetical protein